MRLEFRRPLTEVSAANSAYLDELTAEGKGSVMKMSMDIDPEQAGIVVIIRDRHTNEVIQARQAWASPGKAKR